MSYDHALIYVQILLTVLLFALGIPALVIEPSVEYRIRHILHKHLPFRVVTGLLVATVVVLVSLLIVPPTDQVVQPTESQEKVPSLSDPTLLSRTSGWYRLASVVEIPKVTLEVAVRIATAILILGFALIWWRMSRRDIATALVKRVENGLIRTLRRHGYYADEHLYDLLTIGIHASAGHEKQIVIRALAAVARVIQRSPRYGGAECGSLIHGLLDLVKTLERQGDENNVIDCVEELRAIWWRLEECGFQNESDGMAVVEVACLLGEFAVAISSDAAAIQALNVVDHVAELPFRVGRLAVAAGRFRVSVMCLSQLEAIAERDNKAPKELVALIAHFNNAGESAQSRASHAASLLTREVVERVAAAYYEIGEFATADQVRAMRPPLHRPARHSVE
ncbi:MAG TPA: hypothetical protein VHX14_11995 [Thermoanaerobaculia bacterium]|nr:hypothetical protein [Thermoanaerobaculia bacterium]